MKIFKCKKANEILFLKINIDLYNDGGFDGGDASYFIFLAEDEASKSSDGSVMNIKKKSSRL